MITIFVTLCILITLPGTLELLFLTIGTLLPFKQRKNTRPKPIKTVVVIPAHNEEKNIVKTLTSLKECTGTFDIVVVADHCTDATISKAQTLNTRIIERQSPQKKGKNYALSDAFSALLKEDYDLFVVVDADSTVKANFAEEIWRMVANGANAVQVHYGLSNYSHSWKTRLIHIGFVAFNYLRPKARRKWGLSAGILGNGFALKRNVLESVPYHVDSIVEDLAYHIQLVSAGYQVQFTDATSIFAEIPTTSEGMTSQRTRWEGGRLRVIKETVPLLIREIFKGNLRLAEPLFELLLLPLACHVLFLLILLPVAKIYASLALSIVTLYLIIALVMGKAGIKEVCALAAAPFYILWKLSILLRIVKTSKQHAEWIRTKR